MVSTMACSESPAVSPKRLPEALPTSPAVVDVERWGHRPQRAGEPSDTAWWREQACGCGAGGTEQAPGARWRARSFWEGPSDATSKAHGPAQGPRLGALPTQSMLEHGAHGETEARSTLLTKPPLSSQATTKYPAGAEWNRTRRPQELLADGPTRPGAASPLPAALQQAGAGAERWWDTRPSRTNATGHESPPATTRHGTARRDGRCRSEVLSEPRCGAERVPVAMGARGLCNRRAGLPHRHIPGASRCSEPPFCFFPCLSWRIGWNPCRGWLTKHRLSPASCGAGARLWTRFSISRNLAKPEEHPA